MMTVNTTIAQTPTPTPNPIQIENALTGTTGWQIPCPGAECARQKPALSRKIEGYASATSVNVGETITFYVNLSDTSTTFNLQIYRMGWYGGDGGRLILERNNIAGKHQPLSQSDPDTGLIECNWTLGPAADSNYQWNVPTSAVSGVYIAKIVSVAKNNASYIIFVVRDDARATDIVFQTSDTTWQAYNYYPGNREVTPPANPPDPTNTYSVEYSGMSLYNQRTFGRQLQPIVNGEGVRQGRRVSFNRPYLPDNFLIEKSAGQFFSWEYNMVRWLERNGYDVSYISDIDTHSANNLNGRFSAGKHKLFLSVGHDEYYSWEMRENLEQARNRGINPMNLGFLSANTSFWQIRLDKSSATNTAPADTDYRTITAYKEYARDGNAAAADPYFTNSNSADNYLITNEWRKNLDNTGTCPGGGSSCYKKPEDELLGVQYSFPFNQQVNYPNDSGGVCPIGEFCSATGILKIPVSNCPTWLCDGVTAQSGFYNLGSLIGYEADRIFPLNAADYAASRSIFKTIGDSDVFNIIGDQKVDTLYNSHMVYFKMQNGGKVFSTGTVQYSWGLDDYAPVNYVTGVRLHPVMTNANAQNFTTNMLNQCLLNNASGACQF